MLNKPKLYNMKTQALTLQPSKIVEIYTRKLHIIYLNKQRIIYLFILKSEQCVIYLFFYIKKKVSSC